MFKTLKDKITVSGITVLTVGVALMIFTFVSAYGFLTQGLSILTSGDLAATFGETLAPLIATCIHVMYLGVMVWIGSLLTIRGVTLISQARQTSTVLAEAPAPTTAREEQQIAPKLSAKKSRTKPESKAEAKPYEPEIAVITPEEVSRKEQEPQEQESQQSETEKK